MGCGGSKDEVATGNTVSTRSLLPKKSDSVDPIDNGSEAVIDTAERNPNRELSPPTLEANGAVPSAVEEAKVISKDSPDHYFSSRKDDVAPKVESEGAEYYSPPREPKVDKVEAEIDGAKNENGLASEGGEKIEAEIDGVMVENELVSKGGEEVSLSPKEEEGKAKVEVSADLNEAVSVEEKKPEESNVEQKNLGEGEIGTNDSSPHSV